MKGYKTPEYHFLHNAGRLLSLEYSSLKQFRQSLWLTDIFLSTCYIFYIGYVDLY